MELLVRNAEGNVSDRDRDYAAKKLGRLDRYLHQAQKVEMVHREEKQMHHLEVTVFADGMTIRGEEHDLSIRAAIDRVADKLETRMRKFKGRLIDRHRKKGSHIPNGLVEEHVEPDETENGVIRVSEHKHFLVKPMSVEEAALQMEMIDHAFFVFKNESDGQFSVLYRKKDGSFGLMHPEV